MVGPGGGVLRVCIVTRGDLFPTHHGAAVKIVRTAEALAAAGAPTCVVTDDRDGYLRFTAGRVEQVPFPARFRAAEEWPPLPRLGRLAERLCGQLGYPPEEHFLYRPMFDPGWWMRALEVGRLEGIDVFQAEFPGYGVPAAVAAQLLGRLRAARLGRRGRGGTARCSVVQHNVEWDRLEEFGHPVDRIRPVEQGVLRLVDEVIAVSADDARRMSAAGLPREGITVIPHGVDVGAFQAASWRSAREVRARHGIAEDAPLLFFHGTLHYWPNTEAVRFIAERLLPRLLPELPGLRVMIAGLSPPRYYDHPAIVFTGPVEDLPAHIAAADLCLCPVAHGGGTRMKLLEYMAAGQATVSFTKGAEGIAHEDGRELVIADGPEAFAEACRALLADPGRRLALGEAALRFARAYDWSAVGRAYVSLYSGEGRGEDWNERLLAARRGAPATSELSAPGLQRSRQAVRVAEAAELPAVDAHLPPGRTPSKPLTLLLLLNRGCNLTCSFCDLWQEHIHMPLEQVWPLLDDAAAIGTKTLVLTGGEPFLHKGLFEVVRAGRARGMGVNITTNGLLVGRRWDELVDSGVSSLSFSLDGLAATHDELRGQQGAWGRTLKALDRVLEHGGIGASVYMVVTRTNVRQLPELFDLVKARGAGFDFWPVNDAPELYLRTEEDQAAWRAALEHIAARDPEIARRKAYYLEGLDYHEGREGPVRCLGFVDQYGVTYDGHLMPCCVWEGEGLRMGNVFERPLRELWASPEVQEFRERLHAEGCEVGCWNHSLYEYLVSTGESFRVGRPRGPGEAWTAR